MDTPRCSKITVGFTVELARRPIGRGESGPRIAAASARSDVARSTTVASDLDRGRRRTRLCTRLRNSSLTTRRRHGTGSLRAVRPSGGGVGIGAGGGSRPGTVPGHRFAIQATCRAVTCGKIAAGRVACMKGLPMRGSGRRRCGLDPRVPAWPRRWRTVCGPPSLPTDVGIAVELARGTIGG